MGRRKKTATSEANPQERMYWTDDTEAAIIAYNASDDMEERETLFRSKIAYPLDKMAENVINRFKFPYVNMPFEQLKRQVVSFLVTNLHKFNPSNGAKSFSYFSVVAKNYLILHNNNGYKEEKRHLSLNDQGETFISIEEMIALEAPDEHQHEDSKEFVRLMIRYWDQNMTRHFKKKRDIEIATAIVQLFRDVEGIENFNKKALYVMIREMTDCKTSYITKVINKMRAHTVRQLNEFHEYGTINGDESKYFVYDDPDEDEDEDEASPRWN